MPKRLLAMTLSLLFVAMFVSAEEVPERRLIRIDSSGGTQSGNLRYGPIDYEHPDPEGIVATVSTLTIYAQKAQLRAPEDVRIAQAEGEREASFFDGIRVTRGRLEATGPELTYSEVTGLGIMTERSHIVIEPDQEDGDLVEIDADEITFDVDTDTSISRGNVVLTNADQRAEGDELIFEEERDLGKLSGNGSRVTARRSNDDGELIITADEIRLLPGQDRLLARGNVTVEDGDVISYGELVHFDDNESRAEIIGNPARSEDQAAGTETTGGRLEHRTDLSAVQVLSGTEPSFDEGDFMLREETSAALP